MKRTLVPRWLRSYVLHRDCHKCVYCERPAQCIDHVIPASQGGPDESYNLVASCQGCNSDKWVRIDEVWMRWAFEYLVDVGEDLTPIVENWEGTRIGEWAREA